MLLFLFLIELFLLLNNVSCERRTSKAIASGSMTENYIFDRNRVFRGNIVKNFLRNFLTFSQRGDLSSSRAESLNDYKCNLTSYLDEIYFYSFKHDNYLGDYRGCYNIYKENDSSSLSLFFLSLRDTNLTDNYTTNDFFQFQTYGLKSFILCLPTCISLPNVFNTTIRGTRKEITYLVKNELLFNGTEHDYQHTNKSEFFFIFFSIIFSLFSLVSLFFTLFPTYTDYSNFCSHCRKSKKKPKATLGNLERVNTEVYTYASDTSNLTSNLNIKKPCCKRIRRCLYRFCFDIDFNQKNYQKINIHKELEKLEEKNFYSNLNFTNESVFICSDGSESDEYDNKEESQKYNNLSDSFNLKKNFRRIFLQTNYNKKRTYSYIDDHSLEFFNGIKGLLLAIYCFFLFKWIYYVSPNTQYSMIELTQSKRTSNRQYFYWISYYLLPFISLYWYINAFSLGFKFLSFMKDNKENCKKTCGNELKMLFNFFFPQIYRYVMLVLVYFFILDITDFFSVINYTGGPLHFYHDRFNEKRIEHLSKSCLFLSDIFLKPFDRDIIFNGFLSILQMFTLEISYYLASSLFLYIYFKSSNFGSLLIIFVYFCFVFIKLNLIVFSAKLTYLEIFVEKKLVFNLGYEDYLLSLFMGIAYYEFHHCTDEFKDLVNVNEADSFNIDNESSYLKQVMSNLGTSPKHQNLLVVTLLSFSVLVFYLDFLSIFLDYDKDSLLLKNIPTYERIFMAIGWNYFIFLGMILVFKFLVFTNTTLKKILSMSIWIPLSRMFYTILFIQIPIFIYIALDTSNSLTMLLYHKLYLAFSVLCLSFSLAFFITLLLDIPIKLMFKKFRFKLDREERDHLF